MNFGVVQVVGENQSLIKDFAYFAQEEILAFNERLLLTGGVNPERSSVNGDDKKFYAFPKAAASYRLPFLPPFTDELRSVWRTARRATSRPTASSSPHCPSRCTAVSSAPVPRRSQAPRTSVRRRRRSSRVVSTRSSSAAAPRSDFTVFKKNMTDLILQAAVAQHVRLLDAACSTPARSQNTGTEIGLNVTPVQRAQPELGLAHDVRQRRRSRSRASAALPCFNGGSFFSTRTAQRMSSGLLADDGAGA